MPKSEKSKRWETSEMLDVLGYLFDNFDVWYDRPYFACDEAVKATNVKRSGSSAYVKVYQMIRIMDDYLRTGKKGSNGRYILWQNKKVRDLIKEMCYKTKEKKNEEEAKKDRKKSVISRKVITNTSKSRMDVPQMPFSIESVDEIYKEQIKKVRNFVSKSRETIEAKNQEIRDLYEQISQRRSELVELIEKVKNKLDDLKRFSIV